MRLTHIYCGDGKGKTTAALGLAIRAAGAGMKVHIIQFIKGNETAELNSLKFIENITVDRPQKNYGFTYSMSQTDKAEITEIHNKMLADAYKKMADNEIDMLIIDEYFAAYNSDLLDRELAEKIVFQKAKECELILTGRDPDEKFLTVADYVSEIKAIKHPYQKGISARKGIEF